jgi:DNA polymerase-3 subunit chi
MTEVLFYHLQKQGLEEALPGLLERTLERGWRAVVRAGSEARVEALDAHLWTYRDDSFLPHGSARDGLAEQQPIYLTSGEENPNGAQVLFLVDGARAEAVEPYMRCVDLFDGNDPQAVEAARERYRQARDAGHDVTYWKQSERGRWEKAG